MLVGVELLVVQLQGDDPWETWDELQDPHASSLIDYTEIIISCQSDVQMMAALRCVAKCAHVQCMQCLAKGLLWCR